MKRIKNHLSVGLGLLAAFPLFQNLIADQPDREQLQSIREARVEALERPRRIIFNSDGCDATHLANDSTIEALLEVRSYGLDGSQVDSIFYCPISAGFGLFTHRTEVGEVLTTRDSFLHKNITADLIAQGTDPLQVLIDFSRERDLEIFFSMRMNDTHDAAYNPNDEVDYPLMPQLKKDRPDLLFGTRDQRPPYARWSAVDYGSPEIRELAYAYLEEVCQKYDVDGLELDFFRHPQLFKTAAWEGQATQEEVDLMTEWMRQVRTMTEVEGVRRGKPFLIAVRVPDSLEYCKAIGIDLETWLAEGLVDMLIPSGYFRANEWDYSVELGHRHGVKVYAGLSESRVRDSHLPADVRRRSDKSYRGRAAAAWAAGADGIYSFNEYNAKKPYLREIGDPDALRAMDKVYFASVRGIGNAGAWVAQGANYVEKSVLTPLSPINIGGAKPEKFTIWMDEDFSAKPVVTLVLDMAGVNSAQQVKAWANGHLLPTGELVEESIRFEIDPSWLQVGENEISIQLEDQLKQSVADSEHWTMEYQGDWVMSGREQLPWRRGFEAGDWIEEIRDGYFYFADMGSGEGNMAHLAYPWNLAANSQALLEARLKVDGSTDPLAVAIRISNGESLEYFTLEKDQVGLLFSGVKHPMATNDALHTYQLLIEGNRLRVYADDEMIFDLEGDWGVSAQDTAHWLQLLPGLMDWNQNALFFGSFSGPGKGGAWWDYIRYRTDSVALRDVRIEVTYASE